MNTAKIFTNGLSQAVRLPKEFRFESKEVCVAKVDDMVILYPQDKGWELIAKDIERFTEDFMLNRDQPEESDPRKAI